MSRISKNRRPLIILNAHAFKAISNYFDIAVGGTGVYVDTIFNYTVKQILIEGMFQLPL